MLPDEEVARPLVELAAASAARRRAFAVALELYVQAARLSTDSAARVGRLLAAAAAAIPAGRSDDATAALDAARPEVADPSLLVELEVGRHPGDDRAHGPPGDPHQFGDRGLRALHRQPGALIVERAGVPGIVSSPRHRCDDHPVLGTADARRIGFQHRLHRAESLAPASAAGHAHGRSSGSADTVRAMDAQIEAQFGPDKFVTGIVGELALDSSWWRWATCGHPPALLVRVGRVVKTLDCNRCPARARPAR